MVCEGVDKARVTWVTGVTGLKGFTGMAGVTGVTGRIAKRKETCEGGEMQDKETNKRGTRNDRALHPIWMLEMNDK